MQEEDMPIAKDAKRSFAFIKLNFSQVTGKVKIGLISIWLLRFFRNWFWRSSGFLVLLNVSVKSN